MSHPIDPTDTWLDALSELEARCDQDGWELTLSLATDPEGGAPHGLPDSFVVCR